MTYRSDLLPTRPRHRMPRSSATRTPFAGGTTAPIRFLPTASSVLNYGSRLSEINDGTSNTLFVGEASRFRNEVETWFNEWSSALWWGSSIPGVTRFAAFATTAPRLNANLQIPDPIPSYSYTGDVDSWVYDPNPAVNAAQRRPVRLPQPAPLRRQFPDG